MSEHDIDIETSMKQGRRLDIELGTLALLQVEGLHQRLKTTLVGMETDSYTIFKLPNISIGLKHVLFKGNSIVVHYHQHGSIFSYEARILGTTTDPVRLLFLSMPRVIEEQSLRSAKRVDCYIPCNINIFEEDCPGTIVDLSTAGCRCLLSVPDEKLDKIMHEQDIHIDISVELPEQISLKLGGTLRNVTEYHKALRTGVRFDDLDPETMATLKTILSSNWDEK